MDDLGIGVLRDRVAELKEAATAPETVASYRRRWRQWSTFAAHHHITELPASEDHVAAFALARLEAGASAATVRANLSAIRWQHQQAGLAENVTDTAHQTVSAFGRSDRAAGSAGPAGGPAPIVSFGAVARMAATRGTENQVFSTKLIRVLTGLCPRELVPLERNQIQFSADHTSVVVSTPGAPISGKHPAHPAKVIRLDRGRHPLLCPIRALERLIQAAGDGPIFPPGRLAASTVRGFDPMTNELPHRLIQEIRDHALVLTTYWGALRPEEVGRLQISDLGRTDRTYQLTLRQTKSARNGEVHQVTLHPRTGPLDPCQALDDWIELRGTRPGPLFGAVQPTRPKTSRPGLTSDRIKRIIARRAAAAGVGVPVSGHSLRRSWATHRWLEGVPIKAISAHLRHSETKTTIRYIHNIEGMSPDTGRLLLDEALIYWVGEGRTSFESPAGFSQTPIQTLTVQAAQLRETRAFTPDTSRVYSYHWKRWCRFASASGFEMLPASDEEVGLYLGQLALDGSRPSTLSSHLNAILAAHRQLDREPDHNFAFSKRVIEGHRRRSDPSATPAALTPEQVLAIARSAADQDVETLALVAVCYAGALTTGALTRLYVEDLAESGGHGVSATIAASGRKPTRSVFLPQRQDILDPVNALRSLLGKRTTGPVFERHPGAGYAMSAQAMRERIARAAADAQVTQRVTPTALRKSWAAHARLRGVDPVTIQRHLHHSSPVTTDEFVRLMPTWTENPALTIIEELKLNLPDDRSSL